MIASVLSLDRQAIKTLEIVDEYSIHKTVYDLFPGSERSFLYYKYPQTQSPTLKILILSKKTPEQPELGELESKPVDDSFLHKTRYAFKVRLNPVARSNNIAKAIVGNEALVDWFHKKESGWGFKTVPESLELQDIGVVQFERGSHTITINECTFIGTLEVTNRTLFIEGFRDGLGRSKGFGFGLLQLHPIQ